MLVRKYVGENGLAAMLTAKKSAGVAPKMNLRILLCAGDEACKQEDLPWLETQRIGHQKSKIGVSEVSQKGLMSSKNILKKNV